MGLGNGKECDLPEETHGGGEGVDKRARKARTRDHKQSFVGLRDLDLSYVQSE